MTLRMPIDARRDVPCGKGHSRNDALVIVASGKPQLRCRECHREWLRAWRQRHSSGRPAGRPRKEARS